MSLMPSKLGADPRKIAILGGLVVVAVVVYFYNSNSGGDSSSAPVPSRARSAAASSPNPVAAQRAAERSSFRRVQEDAGGTREFRPSFKPKDLDTTKIDPTLRLDLLAKLKKVDVDAGARSLFEISAAPPPTAQVNVKEPAKIAISHVVGPVWQAPPPPPPEPKAPPIPLKFYGFINKNKADGDRRAFFLDGEDIVIAGEGDMIKKRYKILRIGVNSAVVEDTDFKSNNQQTLPLEAELKG
jgi:hypothetical protein